MRTLGRNPTEDEIMNIMNEIDIDHNGKLDFSEFTMMMRDKLANEDMELEIKQAFRWDPTKKKRSSPLLFLLMIPKGRSDDHDEDEKI